MGYKVRKGRVAIALIIAAAIWYFLTKEKIPKGKLREGEDTSNLWEDVIAYGQDDFVRDHMIGFREHINLIEGKVVKGAAPFKEYNITRCASTAHAIAIYLCGHGGRGGGGDLQYSKLLIDDFRKYLDDSKNRGQSLWEINVYRDKTPSLGHVLVLHQHGDNGEFWDTYMSFISRYGLEDYMNEMKDNRPMTKPKVHEFINNLESMNGKTRWDDEMNEMYDKLFLVNINNDPYVTNSPDKDHEIDFMLKKGEDQFIVNIRQLCANETKYEQSDYSEMHSMGIL